MATITINPDLTAEILSDDESMICRLPAYSPETLVPFGNEDEARAYAQSIVGNPMFFVPNVPPPPPPVPEEISDRQFFHQLALAGLISKMEAVAAVNTGTLPAQVEAIVASLPEDPEFEARMYFAARTYNRSHPFVDQMGAAMALTPEQIDDLWRAAAAL
jgi:hypothetical protein